MNSAQIVEDYENKIQVMQAELNTYQKRCEQYAQAYEQLQQQVKELLDSGMTVEQVREAEELIAPLFAAEGITPSGSVMCQAVMQMHRDAA
jgi:flagellar biosynthesis chaperone FliJ